LREKNGKSLTGELFPAKKGDILEAMQGLADYPVQYNPELADSRSRRFGEIGEAYHEWKSYNLMD
jgi:hypothetical protein